VFDTGRFADIDDIDNDDEDDDDVVDDDDDDDVVDDDDSDDDDDKKDDDCSLFNSGSLVRIDDIKFNLLPLLVTSVGTFHSVGGSGGASPLSKNKFTSSFASSATLVFSILVGSPSICCLVLVLLLLLLLLLLVGKILK